MYVCGACAVLQFTGDYSGTNWDAERAEEIAENLAGYVIIIEDDPLITMHSCLGCGESGGDMFRACYYDETDTN